MWLKKLVIFGSVALMAGCVTDRYDDHHYEDEYEEGVVIIDRDRSIYDRDSGIYDRDVSDRSRMDCEDWDRDGRIESDECVEIRGEDDYYGRDSIVRSDREIEREIRLELDRYNLDEVRIRVDDRDVYMYGWVNTRRDREIAYDIARRIGGVDDIDARDVRIG